jgi:hypothetical protein
MSTNSLCFKEAHDARISGEIGLEEFLRHIAAHYGGVRHQADAEGQRPYIPSLFERDVSRIALNENMQLLDDDSE